MGQTVLHTHFYVPEILSLQFFSNILSQASRNILRLYLVIYAKKIGLNDVLGILYE